MVDIAILTIIATNKVLITALDTKIGISNLELGLNP
jgi:hypothetical protein